MKLLKFSAANAKTVSLAGHPELVRWLSASPSFPRGKKVYSFDLPAGKTCPGAKDCKSCAVLRDGKYTIQDGKDCIFRCFSATQEVVYPTVRRARQYNLDLLNGCKHVDEIVGLITLSLPKKAGVIRLHVSGDFYSLGYLRAWMQVAEENPCILFYAYTKSLHLFKRTDFVAPRVGRLRDNFYITASKGGRFDHLVPELGLRTSKVVFTEKQAGRLPIDHDDSHAATAGYSFALLLHGVQPAGSPASVALRALKGKGGYTRKGGN